MKMIDNCIAYRIVLTFPLPSRCIGTAFLFIPLYAAIIFSIFKATFKIDSSTTIKKAL